MPGGWGRRAAGKQNQLEDDELFKSIGGQLEASNFDYSQWQRSDRRSPLRPPAPPKLTAAKTQDAELAADKAAFVVSKRPPAEPSKRHESASTTSCKHPFTRKGLPSAGSQDRSKVEGIKILQLRIHARRQTLNDYKKRQLELIEQNIEMKTQIESKEDHTHDHVKHLLTKYEKFRGGIATLNERFSQDLREAQTDLEESKDRITEELAVLNGQVEALDTTLKEHQEQVHILVNYKDKEYPVKALRISELQKEIEQLKVSNEEDENELKHVMETELEKFHRKQNHSSKGLTEKVTEEAIDMMHPSLKDMAMQNLVMKKEIEFHKKEIEELEEENVSLSVDVEKLLKDPKTNTKLQLFPEFFPTQQKCTPDMDVVLDIPTQEWLPI